MGTTLLVSPYPVFFTAATIGVSSGHRDMAWLYVPVAGPFIAAREADVSTGHAAALITAGIAQSMGLGLLLVAPVLESKEAESTSVGIYPVLSPTDLGVSLSAVF